jgi:hypothetical protein
MGELPTSIGYKADESSSIGHQVARTNGQSSARALHPTEPISGHDHEPDQGSEIGSAARAINNRGASQTPTIPRNADLKQCQDLLYALQSRLVELSSHGDDNSLGGKFTGTASKSGRDTMLDSTMGSTIQLNITADLCEREWEPFMNKSASKTSEYAIEVLIGEPDYHPRRVASKSGKKRPRAPELGVGPDSQASENLVETSVMDSAMPNRIRINSLPILQLLKTWDDSIDDTTALVMLRPFKPLVHHGSAVRDAIIHLKQQMNVPTSMTPDASVRESGLDTSGASTPDMDRASIVESLKHMEVLQTFMDRYLKPRLIRITTDLDAKVRFSDLWLLFKPGDDIHMPLQIQDTSINAEGIGITPETFQSRYNKLWRVTSISGGRQNIQDAQSRSADPRPNNFKVDCYYIDFHGRFFRPTVHAFEIAPFEGEVPVTSLEFYPVRFLEAVPEQRTLDENLQKGRVVYEKMAHSYTHFFYSGPTLMVHPCGCKMTGGPTIQEHIESEVIVDFKMALRKNPTWMPQREPWKDPVSQPEEVIENSKVKYWSDDGKRKKIQRTELDQVYDDYAIDRERALTFQNEETIFAPIPGGWTSNEKMVPEKDVKLLPGRVYAFILRTRTFSESYSDISTRRYGALTCLSRSNMAEWASTYQGSARWPPQPSTERQLLQRHIAGVGEDTLRAGCISAWDTLSVRHRTRKRYLAIDTGLQEANHDLQARV